MKRCAPAVRNAAAKIRKKKDVTLFASLLAMLPARQLSSFRGPTDMWSQSESRQGEKLKQDNQHEIGAEVNKYVNLGDSLTNALVRHIELAGKMAGEPITKNVEAFIRQGDDIARILSAINPKFLPVRDAQTEMRTHTNHVVTLYTILKEGRFSDEIVELDAYYNHVLSLADAMYALLSNPSRYLY